MYKGLEDESFRILPNPLSARFRIQTEHESATLVLVAVFVHDLLIFSPSYFAELQQKTPPAIIGDGDG